jgi:DNA-directed RNA polymerase subunit H (RpoH/RPB5)
MPGAHFSPWGNECAGGLRARAWWGVAVGTFRRPVAPASARHGTMDDDSDGGTGGSGNGGRGAAADGASSAPSRAAELASATEAQRATLGRAMHVLVRMLHCRGYTVTAAGGHAVCVGPGDTDPASVGNVALAAALAEFQDKARAAAAEAEDEVVLRGVVGTGACAPPPGTPAAAAGLPPGTSLAVVSISKGNAEGVRGVLAALREGPDPINTVVLVSRVPLTSFVHKFLAAQTKPAAEYFHMTEVQGCVVDHHLVPRHVVLTDEQVAKVRRQYTAARFPELRTKDPVARFLGLTPGTTVFVRECWGRAPPHPTFFTVVRGKM